MPSKKDTQKLRLNIGCGEIRIPGTVGVDIVETSETDVVHDLETFPYPFEDNSVEWVIMDNVMEHMSNPMRVIEELWRICCHDAEVHIHVPYAKSDGAFKDPTHKSFYIERTFQYFEEGYRLNFYSHARLKVENVEMIAHSYDMRQKLRNLIPFRKYLKFLFLNMYDELRFTLRIKKNDASK